MPTGLAVSVVAGAQLALQYTKNARVHVDHQLWSALGSHQDYGRAPENGTRRLVQWCGDSAECVRVEKHS